MLEALNGAMDDVLTDREVAALLKLSPSFGYKTVQRLARQRKIKGIRVGDLWRFTRRSIRNYLESK